MPCFKPRPAWHYYRGGRPTLRAPEPHELWAYRYIDLPCGSCIGCRVRTARDWSIRCLLEMQEHDEACWVTLTYDEDTVPRLDGRRTLYKPDLSQYLKRLRSRVEPVRFRFFGVGEYGTQGTKRPHYHVILFGLGRDNRHIEAAWPLGFAQALPLTPAAIAYTAGYAQKKISAEEEDDEEGVDQETGEVIERPRPRQPPFRLMSRGGRSGAGIGGHARRYRDSWRRSAIWRGAEVPVPRYLAAAWKDTATERELEELQAELSQFPRLDFPRREAGEVIALAKYHQQSQRRKL